MTLPKGTVVNPEFPGACGVRFGTALRLSDAVLGCLAQAAPDKVPAASAGAISPVVCSLMNPATGRRHVTVVEPMIGGGGRGPDDGRRPRLRPDPRLPAQHADREHRGRRADRDAPLRPDPGFGRPGPPPGGHGDPDGLPGLPPRRHRHRARPGAVQDPAVGRGGRHLRHRRRHHREPGRPGAARHRQDRLPAAPARRHRQHPRPRRRRPRGPARAGPGAGGDRRAGRSWSARASARDAYGVVLRDGAVDEAATDARRRRSGRRGPGRNGAFDLGPVPAGPRRALAGGRVGRVRPARQHAADSGARLRQAPAVRGHPGGGADASARARRRPGGLGGRRTRPSAGR